MPTIEYLNYAVVEEQGWDIDDEANFERAAEMDLPEDDYGTFEIGENEKILDASDEAGCDWPSSCEMASCGRCAAILVDGEIEMDTQHIFSSEEVDEENFRLTCSGSPASDHVKILFNASTATPYW